MKNRKAILHISDLHIDSFKGKGNKYHKSRNDNKEYIEILMDALNKIVEEDKIQIERIIITGDLTNRSTPAEYMKVKEFLNKLVSGVGCSHNQIIMVPGNHDINWTDCQSELELKEVENSNVDPATFHNIKFAKFKAFYEEFSSEEFNPQKAICSEMYYDTGNILFIGMNSLYKESNLDHLGYINEELLEEELVKIEEKHKDKSPNKIALFHHPPDFGIGESKNALQNWESLNRIFKKHDISIFIFGHVHKSVIKEEDKYLFIGCASLALEDSSLANSFLLYTSENDFQDFEVDKYIFIPEYANCGKWIKDTVDNNNKFKLNRKSIEKKYNLQLARIKDEKFSPFGEESNFENEYLNSNSRIAEVLSKEENDNNKLINIVKKERMFISGHFHWGDNLKAHGWLNTNLLLGKNYNIKFSIKSIINLIIEKNINPGFIIGIGMEGNILGSMIALLLGKKYTYVPVDNRGATDVEERIEKIDATDVLFITDTIFSGNTMKSIMSKYKGSFGDRIKVTHISLFCTGDIKEIKEKVKDVEFYTVCDEIKIMTCDKNKEECAVNQNKLALIHEF